jgi:Tol biopolymer transport system component/tRNA A-37 threonylcarbamoyl transferase component Bud32
MALTSGTKLGPYEILGAAGAGGMGEVYRARDTRLDRTVAVKVLSTHLAERPDLQKRFEREARTISKLTHPHICALYDVGQQEGVDFLVMEYLEGETLSHRLQRGPLPIEQTLKYGIEIAAALEAAHRQGIVHRDLKPGNVMLTKAGAKLMDFGLAKLAEQPAPVAVALSEMADAPTLPSQEKSLTEEGVIVGTFQYMAPEQLEGKEADARTDLFALGMVLYEMATGRPAFTGKTKASVIAAILSSEPPPISSLQPLTPPAFDRVVKTCLAKEPDERFQTAHDLNLQLRWIAEGGSQAGVAAPVVARRRNRERLAWALAAALFLGLLGAIGSAGWRQAPRTTAAPVTHTAIELPASAQLALGTVIPLEGFDNDVIALSPDGRYLAYVGQAPGGTMLYLREVAGLSVAPVAGTEGARYAFFSPDSRSLGFLTDDKVKRVAIDGGTPVTLCDAVAPVRATWTNNDNIYFGESEGQRIARVPAAGGGATLLAPSANDTTFSQALPDGAWALATAKTRGISHDYSDVVLLSLTGGPSKVLVHSGYDARFVSPGYLLFGRAGSLFAVRFDAGRREVIGEPQPVVAGVAMESFFSQVHAAVSDNGLIAYVPGGDRALGRLAWVDRQGRTEVLSPPARIYGSLALSPNGQRLAVHMADVTDYIWVYDFGRGEGRGLTFKGNSGWPVWNPDNATIAFSAYQSTKSRIMVRQADGGGAVRQLGPEFDNLKSPTSWSPDGRMLATDAWPGDSGFLSVNDGVVNRGWMRGWGAVFSPDGRWVAYTSTEARSEIVVSSYPDGKITHQISTDGGIEPLWCSCGELFYRNGNRWMSASIRTQPELTWQPPRLAFQTDFVDTPGLSYAVSPDGKRLLVVKPATPDVRSRVHLVTNWMERLKTH